MSAPAKLPPLNRRVDLVFALENEVNEHLHDVRRKLDEIMMAFDWAIDPSDCALDISSDEGRAQFVENTRQQFIDALRGLHGASLVLERCRSELQDQLFNRKKGDA